MRAASVPRGFLGSLLGEAALGACRGTAREGTGSATAAPGHGSGGHRGCHRRTGSLSHLA